MHVSSALRCAKQAATSSSLTTVDLRAGAVRVHSAVSVAAQPFQTVAGPGLTLNFQFDPQQFPFQRLPLSNPVVPALYTHTLLDALSEFAETPRTVRHRRTNAMHVAPMPNFWDAVGTLNTTYSTLTTLPLSSSKPKQQDNVSNSTGQRHRGDGSSGMVVPVDAHPALGTIELVHRSKGTGLLDVRTTLYSAQHEPLSTSVMTGPTTDKGLLVSAAEAEAQQAALQRKSVYSSSDVTVAIKEGRSESDTSSSSTVVAGSVRRLPSSGAPNTSGSNSSATSFAALAILPSSFCVETATSISTTVDGGGAAAAESSRIAPPWVLYRLVVDFWEQVSATHPELVEECTTGGPSATASSSSWCLLSHRSVLNGDLRIDHPIELVSAVPKVMQRFYVPQWKHTMGLPWMHHPAPVVALHLECRQEGVVVASGVFYLGLQLRPLQ